MFSVNIFILWTTCLKIDASFSIGNEQANSTQSVIITDWSTVSNESMIEDEIAFRRRVEESLIPSDAQNISELAVQDLQPVSHTSLTDFENDNSTQLLLQRMRKRNKELRIRAVKEYLLHITWNNRTSNHSSSGRTPRGIEEAFWQVFGGFETFSQVFGSLKRDESMLPQEPEDVEYSIDPDYPEEIIVNGKIYYEKLLVTFDELGLEDIILAPGGVLWTVCGNSSNVMPEILRRLDDYTYPLPLRISARFTLGERFGFSVSKTKPRCVPSEWKSMRIIYLDGYRPMHVELSRFVPTSCSCTRLTSDVPLED